MYHKEKEERKKERKRLEKIYATFW